jgi:very-short-patch-repair endonuclease
VDTLLLLADCVPLDWWIAALDAALHRPRRGGEPLLSESEHARFVERLPRRLQKELRLVDPRAESPLETLLRLGLIRRGIGPLTPQFAPDPWREVDILVGERLVLEADGREFHDPEKDAIRDAYLRSLGYVVLRFDYDRIVFDLEAVLDEIEGILRTLDSAL